MNEWMDKVFETVVANGHCCPLLLRFFERLLDCDLGAVLGLEFFGDLLDFAEDAEEIAAEDFAAVFG
jgi:hypothetical protein